jgi:8-oxo-dGTP diphosphatase
MNDRLFPARPILAVSASVFREGRVLIARRARATLLGHFSLPGGVVEVGETLAAALARELMEEVGVEAEIIAFNWRVEAMLPEGDRVRAHFVIASFVAAAREESRA